MLGRFSDKILLFIAGEFFGSIFSSEGVREVFLDDPELVLLEGPEPDADVLFFK